VYIEDCPKTIAEQSGISVSFQASRSSPLTMASTPLHFDTCSVGNFNLKNNSFTAPVSGYYWLLHVSVAVPNASYADVRLASRLGSQAILAIHRYHSSFKEGAVTTSSYGIRHLAKGTSIQLSSSYALYNDTGLHISLGGFLLDSLMRPLVAFSASMSSTSKWLQCDVIQLDTHCGWELNKYTVPVSGTYVITFVGGEEKERTLIAGYQVNEGPEMWDLAAFYEKRHTGNDTVSALVMVQLSAGDVFSFLVKPDAVMVNQLTTSAFSIRLYIPTKPFFSE
jgi:hypothetical protein